MPATVNYPGGSLVLPLEDAKLVGVWSGPPGRSGDDLGDEIRHALEHPLDFPALRLAVVPGDRVTIAVDPLVPELPSVLATVVGVLESSGIERDAIRVLSTGPLRPDWETQMPAGVALGVHDIDDREAMSYLATTSRDRRIYLNRLAADADFVLPIGRISRDGLLGARGPWTTIFPGLSDRDTKRDLAKNAVKNGADGAKAVLEESEEVGWLLGNQFQIAVVPGSTGVAGVFAGASSAVKASSLDALDAAWTFRADRRADLVVVGVSPQAGFEGVSAAFATGTALVRRGGKIVALSDATGPYGPATMRLANAESPGSTQTSLRGAEGEVDFPAAQQLAAALAWADLFLSSGFGLDAVEDLGIIPLSKPDEARRLAASSPQVTLVNNADLTLGQIAEDDE
ncbi:MAG: hypothetical protein JWN86_1529 [Planctomycetota bacterium]|nr:hypothetical protein [Planctomycetota bacterium]